MKKKLLSCCLIIIIPFMVFSQSENKIGKNVSISIKDFKSNLSKSQQVNGLTAKMTMKFPLPDGKIGDFVFDETLISAQKIANVQTFDAISSDGKVKMKLTIMGDKVEGIMHTPDGYFFIEPVDVKNDLYRIYTNQELPADKTEIRCNVEEKDLEAPKNGRMLSITPFPVGTQLRKYTLAAAATGEMTGYYEGQANALAKIVSITNATNLIYELEAAMTFQLATQTTNFTIIFTNPATDPFGTIDPTNCQTSFTAMNTSGILPYSAYGIGHTFNTLADLGGGSYSSNGVAGPTPCVDAQKSRAFTQWTFDAPVSLIVSVFAHEVGHQFSAPHTYNAVGGTAGSPTFCLNGWSSTSAIEPGSGSTLMSYKNNCVNPTNYTLSGSNGLQYFNTKSLEFIFNAVNGSSGTCITSVATGNTPPVSNAGADITIPKGTPFTLNGTATDSNGDAMTYTWEQYDVATANDKGALGSSINGAGGYSAVNSTTAPLFRSEQSSSITSRTFPKLSYILNNANNPADNEGEDLPQVARSMNFRFTVRDNKTGGGGVDSDEILVTVSANGPFSVAIPNGSESWAASGSQTVTWNVNSTNSLAANVNILLSIDGGNTFPYTLATNTPNDGSQAVTLPNLPASTQGRIKIVANLNANATFFDISDANFTITSTCNAFSSYVCPSTDLSATQGSASLNLALSAAPKASSPILSKSMTITTATVTPVIGYTDATHTTCTSLSTYYTTVFAFRVSKTGTYTLTNSTGGFLIMAVHSANTSLSCANFVGGNAHTGVSVSSSMSLTLNECTDYYLYICNFSTSGTYSVGFSGAGDVFEKLSTPAGIAYTYAAISNTDNLIKVVSSTGNFTTLAPGTYTVYGISYDNTLNPATFVGQTLAAIMGGTNCLFPSNNNKKITVTCTSTPSAPTATGGSRCGTGTVSLSATGCAGTYNWYASSTGGASLGTGSTFTTPSISTTTTYFVDCTVSGCTSTSRSSAIATVNTVPSVPTVTGGGSCLNSPATLTASGCAGTYNWYTALTGGALLTTGASLTGLTSSGTYYVDCTVGTCVSSRASGTITVKPAAPSVAGVTILTGQTATLTATGCSGTVKWYASATGTAILLTGTSYTTPALTINTTYYADCTVSSCTSATRTAATVTISTCPSTLTLVSTADDIASGNITKQASATVSAAPNANIMATNKVTGVGTRATYQAKSILLNPGFKADTGTIFKAEIGGCN